MKKKLFLLLIPLFLVSLFATRLALAAGDEKKQKVVVLPRDEVVEGDYFTAGERVTLSGTINGDAYVAGAIVVVEGVINGDLLAAGGVVTVRGKVANDVRVAGGEVTLSSEVGGNVTVLAGSVNITDSAKIEGSLVGTGGRLAVFGPVTKGATLGAGEATFGSAVGGDILAYVGELVFTPSAQVTGDLTYQSEEEVQIQEGAQIGGEITYKPASKEVVEKVKPEKAAGFFAGAGMAFKLISLLSALIIGLLMLKLFPRYTQKTVDMVEKRPWASLGIGFLTLILTPIVFILLLITVVGIPLAFILLAIFLITLYLAKIFVTLFVGQKIFKFLGRKVRNGWVLLLGLVVYTFLTAIPILGNLIGAVVLLSGLGAVVLERKTAH